MSENKVRISCAKDSLGRDEYVLRRGVIITDRNLFSTRRGNSGVDQYVFGHNDIIIPVATLEATRNYINDFRGKGMKKMIGERANEYLTTIEKQAFTDQGYPRGNGSYIKIVDCYSIAENIKDIYGLSEYDKRVLQVCKERAELKKKKNDKSKVILISSNISMRFHATRIAKISNLNIFAKPYEDDMYPEPAKQYKGMIEVEAEHQYVEKVINGKTIDYEYVKDYDLKKWFNNMFVTLKSPLNSSALAIYSHGKIYPIDESYLEMSKVTPLNKEQKFFAYAFQKNPEESSVIITKGSAGVGKTFITLAAALSRLDSKIIDRVYYDNNSTPSNPKDKHSTDHAGKKSTDAGNGEENTPKLPRLNIGCKKGDFDKIIITTPIVTVSNEEIGILPGDKDAKTSPYFGGIMDNLAKIIARTNPNYTPRQIEISIEKLFFHGIIEIIPISYMRGRSFDRRCVILDEAQNVEPDDILDIVSRLGEGSRIVILGDPQQVNKVGLNKRCNGIVYATEGLKEFEGCYVITFSDSKIRRSSLAKYAVQNLL